MHYIEQCCVRWLIFIDNWRVSVVKRNYRVWDRVGNLLDVGLCLLTSGIHLRNETCIHPEVTVSGRRIWEEAMEEGRLCYRRDRVRRSRSGLFLSTPGLSLNR